MRLCGIIKHYSIWASEPAQHSYIICAPSGAEIAHFTSKNNTQYSINIAFTCVGDVKPLSRVWVVRLELQAHYMPITGDLRRYILPRECSKSGGLWHPIVFHNKIVKLGLQLKIAENEMDPIARLRYNEPHTVHVVSVFLWVVWREDDAWRSGEIEEAGDCGEEDKYI